MQWQPIGTAPETDDLEPVLWLYEKHDMGGFMFAGTRNADGHWLDNLELNRQYPTHWMRLPSPPGASPMTHKPDSGSQTPGCDPQALMPCPFCGSADVKSRSNGWGKVYHQCQSCGASGPSRTVSLQKPWPDVEVWNTRVQADQIATLTAEVERLAGALRPFADAADARRSKKLQGAVCFTQPRLLAARAAPAERKEK